jgi:hypothetical protein
MATDTIEVRGHIVDSLILAKVLDAVLEAGADYELAEGFHSCVDVNQAVVTELADSGSHQAIGIVTDIGVFVRTLTGELCG